MAHDTEKMTNLVSSHLMRPFSVGRAPYVTEGADGNQLIQRALRVFLSVLRAAPQRVIGTTTTHAQHLGSLE